MFSFFFIVLVSVPWESLWVRVLPIFAFAATYTLDTFWMFNLQFTRHIRGSGKECNNFVRIYASRGSHTWQASVWTVISYQSIICSTEFALLHTAFAARVVVPSSPFYKDLNFVNVFYGMSNIFTLTIIRQIVSDTIIQHLSISTWRTHFISLPLFCRLDPSNWYRISSQFYAIFAAT